MQGDAAVLVPVKAFGQAKRRLSPVLAPGARAALSRRLAAGVIAAARPLPIAVVCDDREVAAWAHALGAVVIWVPGRGLNGAVADGVAHLGVLGVSTVIVAHGDLARPEGLLRVFEDHPAGGFTLVPDGRDDGTNVAVVPSDAGFHFSYGPGSFRRHLDEVVSSELAVRVVRGTDLSLDVDVPADLALMDPSPRTPR